MFLIKKKYLFKSHVSKSVEAFLVICFRYFEDTDCNLIIGVSLNQLKMGKMVTNARLFKLPFLLIWAQVHTKPYPGMLAN